MKARHYDRSSIGHDHDGSVAELHWQDGRVVQVSGSEADDARGLHLLIRVWPENGTAENGGSNLTSLSILLRPHGEGWQVASIDHRQP